MNFPLLNFLLVLRSILQKSHLSSFKIKRQNITSKSLSLSHQSICLFLSMHIFIIRTCLTFCLYSYSKTCSKRSILSVHDDIMWPFLNFNHTGNHEKPHLSVEDLGERSIRVQFAGWGMKSTQLVSIINSFLSLHSHRFCSIYFFSS